MHGGGRVNIKDSTYQAIVKHHPGQGGFHKIAACLETLMYLVLEKHNLVKMIFLAVVELKIKQDQRCFPGVYNMWKNGVDHCGSRVNHGRALLTQPEPRPALQLEPVDSSNCSSAKEKAAPFLFSSFTSSLLSLSVWPFISPAAISSVYMCYWKGIFWLLDNSMFTRISLF